MIKLGNYNKNSARNANYVQIGTLKLYFSYETIVAFTDESGNTRVCKNIRSNTTGKHLNWIDGGRKDARLDKEIFDEALQLALLAHNLA